MIMSTREIMIYNTCYLSAKKCWYTKKAVIIRLSQLVPPLDRRAFMADAIWGMGQVDERDAEAVCEGRGRVNLILLNPDDAFLVLA